MKLKGKLIALEASSMAVSVAPLITTFIVNRKQYITSVSSGFKLTVGGMIVLILCGMKAFGKIKVPRRIVVSGAVFVIAYLLQPLLQDFVLLSGMFFAGEAADGIFFEHPISKMRQKLNIQDALPKEGKT